MIGRMTFSRVAGIAFAIACFGFESVAGGCASQPSVTLPQGTVKGFRDASGSSIYLGVPFAATTGGENR